MLQVLLLIKRLLVYAVPCLVGAVDRARGPARGTVGEPMGRFLRFLNARACDMGSTHGGGLQTTVKLWPCGPQHYMKYKKI